MSVFLYAACDGLERLTNRVQIAGDAEAYLHGKGSEEITDLLQRLQVEAVSFLTMSNIFIG